jgi:hypothetical protein
MIVATKYALLILRGKETPMPDVMLHDRELSNSSYPCVINAPLANSDAKLACAFIRRAL